MRLVLPLLLLLSLSACSLPRFIVLNDSLDSSQHNDLGIAYERRGETDLAEREYRKAARLDADWATPWFNLGNLYAGASNWPQATDFYRKALERDPQSAEAMNNLAWVMLQDGHRDEALSWAQQAASLSADSPAVLDTLAEVHMARHENGWAKKVVARALQLSPDEEMREKLEAKRQKLAKSGL